MTEEELLRRIEALREAVQEGRRHVVIIGMTREQRETIERHLDHIMARLDRARETLANLRAPMV